MAMVVPFCPARAVRPDLHQYTAPSAVEDYNQSATHNTVLRLLSRLLLSILEKFFESGTMSGARAGPCQSGAHPSVSCLTWHAIYLCRKDSVSIGSS